MILLSLKTLGLLFLLLIATTTSQAQVNIRDTYESAFTRLESMLTGTTAISFKKAVILTEQAYLNNQIDTIEFQSAIEKLCSAITYFNSTNKLLYDYKDKESVSKWASIFKVMTDTTFIIEDSVVVEYLPFIYDFDDFFGEKDWSKMFVVKLLQSGEGNCHSLPYLYKILSEELNTTASLALAPNHIYIKHKSLKNGMYNTELTSASFPIDAWIMASGYIHLTAIQNGVYMKALTDKESIALCLIDLAEGYKRKSNNSDTDFIIKCCDKALEYFPNCVNAIILKAETIKSKHDRLSSENPNPPNEIKMQIHRLFNEMQDLYVKVHKLGYRQMPKDMYMKWLVELKTERDKYQNKNVTSYDK
jgi:hypothetical protein